MKPTIQQFEQVNSTFTYSGNEFLHQYCAFVAKRLFEEMKNIQADRKNLIDSCREIMISAKQLIKNMPMFDDEGSQHRKRKCIIS